MKRLFLTGASGFVGRHVLSAAGPGRDAFDIVCPPPGFDLLQPRSIDEALAASRPDAILHLAAQSNVPQAFRDPEGTFAVNALGTLRLLEAASRAGLSPRVLLASSGDVYGRVPEAEMPIAESRLPAPANPYAASKVAAEAICLQAARSGGAPCLVARSFNHVGAGQSDGFALPAFARQIAEIRAGRREPVLLVGDIETTRDFTHVDDVVDAYFTLLDRGEAGGVYNVCSGRELRVRDLLERLVAMSGARIEIRVDEARLRPSDQRRVRGDSSRLQALGWRPRRAIDVALGEILEDWSRRVAAAN